MKNFAEVIESELSAAIMNKDIEAVKRFSFIISNKIEDEDNEIKSDIKILAEVMKKGFDDINLRFEDMNKRVEDINNRFEHMNNRFNDFNLRFEVISKKFNMMFRFMSIGFSVVTILIVIFKFVR
ncbi:MAG: hypothetical protein SVR08_06730 [Spirochaetota bacterium]|nr:hypothetical protein [Spirochaetota bacterium]